jgi:endonuclease/exonuclease/phosphatase family metal-dependent hydrolase
MEHQMKIKVMLLLAIVLSSCGRITVMSYNVHAMRGMDKVLDAERIAHVIKDHNPDLVALQEVDMFTERSGGMDAIAILEDITGMDGIFMKTFDYQGGEFGNAVLSKFPIIDQELIRLPSREEYEPRLMMMISVLAGKNDTLHFYATHLDHHREDSDRPMQMKAIIDVIEKDRFKVILAGDLNCQPGSEPLNMLDKVLTRCPSDELTYPADKPYWTIDHIYYSKAKGIRDLGLTVIPETVASDHRPIITQFKLK